MSSISGARLALLVCCVVAGCPHAAAAQPAGPAHGLVLEANLEKSRFAQGEGIVLICRLKNAGRNNVLVNRILLLGYTVWVEITDATGTKVPWCGKIFSKGDSADEYAVLLPGASVKSKLTISCDERRFRGYDITQPGRYVAVAEYSDPTPEVVLKELARRALKELGKKVAIAKKPLRAEPVEFSIDESR
jgi:hypothetical protein